MANFLWGSAGQKMSPAQVAEQRKIAQALMAEGSDTSPVGHWTAALNRGLQGYLGGRQAYQAREAENAGRAGLEAKRAGQANAATFGGADPVAAALAGGQGAAGGSGGSLNLGGDLTSGIAETAAALGMDPVDLATIISYETAGTFDPTKAGPTTQWGQHRGLIQFGEPQAAEYGVDWNNPVGSQLGANGAIVNYFTKNGWQPGMGLLDAYSIVNAGAPGRYNASDANNGGAPGTVADKVNNQMAGHRQKAMSLFGGGGAAPANSTANIAALLADEWLPEGERAVLQAQYESQLKQQDPMYQAQYEGQVLANQAAMQPQREKPLVINNQLVDPATMQVLGDYRDANNEGFNPDRYRVVGNTLFDLSAEGGPRPVADGTGTEEVIFGADGQPILVRGSAGAAKSFTEAQSKDVGFSTRMRGAEEQLAPIENALTSFSYLALNADPTGLVRGSLQSEEFQKAQQASKTWLLAFLRKDSGAATTKEEDALYGQTFLPQPGDGTGVISQKRQMRDLAMRAVEAGMSPTQAMAQARALNGNQAPPPQAAQPDAGAPQAPARINSKAEFDALPSGATFIAPDGTTRRKP